MLISQIERRIIFQQVKFFKITNNSYKTNAYRNTNVNQTFLQIQKRHYGIKDFVEAFREKLDENIKQTPEFGGDLKKLSDASSTASSSVKQATGKVSESVEAVKKKTQELIEPIAANPQVQEAGKKAAEATKTTAKGLGGLLGMAFDLFVRYFTYPIKKLYKKTALKKELDVIFRYRWASSRHKFDPTIFDESLVNVPGQTIQPVKTGGITEYQDKEWKENLKGKVGQKWNDLGEGDTRLSVLIEKADSYGSSLKKMSNSRITAVVNEIRTVFPNFRYLNFRAWISKVFFVKTLRGDSGLYGIQSERVRKKFMDKVLPKPWRHVKVLHIDVYEHPESTFAFIFTLRGRAMHFETDKETNITTTKPIAFTISIAVKLNELGFWQLTDYHDIEIADAPF